MLRIGTRRSGMGTEAQQILFEECGLSGLEKVAIGDEVLLVYRGLAVLSYGAEDRVGRDMAVAMLLRNGMKGKSVARLCGMSEGHVTGVRKRLAAGGLEALAVRGRMGRPRALTERQEVRLRELHAAGMSQKAMASALDTSRNVVRGALTRLGLMGSGTHVQKSLQGIGVAASPRPLESPVGHLSKAEEDEELKPGADLPCGPAEHPSRYAGTLLLAAAMAKLGVDEALDAANARRRPTAIYDAQQMATALACAWVAGFPSLESMHERDAGGLGVVLGLERSPSVRTIHRAIGEMVTDFDPIEFGTGLMKGLREAGREQPRLFGIDGHFKEYTGKAPIDKGWNPHKRMATKGLGLVLVHDAEGKTWLSLPTGAGDALSQHVLPAARRLRQVHGPEAPIVLGFDRGGFCFETLRALHDEGFGYLAWVPATAKTPPLASVAPEQDGVGAVVWEHPDLPHVARLIVQRDGDALLPAVTNLSDEVVPEEALRMLRLVRGVEENAIKSARASVHIDRLADRGIAREQADDRLVSNPERATLRAAKKALETRIAILEEQEPLSADTISPLRLCAELEEAVVDHALRATPAKLPRVELEPGARRAWLRTKNRALLLPLKLAADNARRWLLCVLGAALAPTDNAYDASTMPRTLIALLRAPGTVRFTRDEVVVTLDLPLPPTAHARLDDALRSLAAHDLVFPDKPGRTPRRLQIQLARRPTRDTLPHHAADSEC